MATTAADIIRRALEDVGVVGVGQNPLPEDTNYGLSRLNAMIGQFNRRRWLVFHTVDIGCVTTGLNVYSVGVGGNFNVTRPDKLENGCYFRQYQGGSAASGGAASGGDFNTDYNNDFSIGQTSSNSNFGQTSSNSNFVSAGDFNADFNSDFNTQSVSGTLTSQPNGYAIDYPLTILNSREDWNRVALKNMPSWPSFVFYDPANMMSLPVGSPVGGQTFPTGYLYVNPVPAAGQFELHILVKDVLSTYPTPTTTLSVPPEYEEAFEYNLAIRFAAKYQIEASREVLGLAKASLATIRSANTQVPLIGLPTGLTASGARYNVYSDRNF